VFHIAEIVPEPFTRPCPLKPHFHTLLTLPAYCFSHQDRLRCAGLTRAG
jgi:hypothetical protein